MRKRMKIGVCSGYFDPLHVGHLENLNKAKALVDYLVVIVNNGEQSVLKKGYEFQPFKDRQEIVLNLKCVDAVFPSIDLDKTVCLSLQTLADTCRETWHNCEIYFLKGGDRFSGEIPESLVCKKYNIKIVDGLGKKIRSSSVLVKRARAM